MKTNFKHEDPSLRRAKKKNRTVAKARAKKRRALEARKVLVYAAVDRRDGGRCRVCATCVNIHHHHVRFRSQQGAHTTENVLLLCAHHHERVHRREILVLGVDANRPVRFRWVKENLETGCML